ncbi:Eco57I restriction-modification methylase domain-containing protein [Myroides odoratimimus]|uniref:Eco57I restriction-modification methylase domain-containing protein n=1 Tax=Myroides odoratimimus TaxID=76832 RepID=UPI002574B5D9|nr:Eco57I restriction-modification methylase domain-containing protein [Myroides odoratimimus]MDM1454883.1 Eco57I restriction-modification methylase domain-containing protein [Myroides odoratimimus]MDM1478605.1 Eco57I restriction-modification methylase domain-containing protein [Myroides odoratimimus]MDM1490947.1 Eco57I restriction-modification methylase domain-containing protein [Myroides odoratimimus]
MPKTNTINLNLLDYLIYGRVEPQLYAFTTETIPNYLKIGDTYRPVDKRLNEWKKFFPNLERKFTAVAKINDDIYYRDLSVHIYLEKDLHKTRLLPEVIPSIPYYSKEFFKNTSIEDINLAISDIKLNFEKNSGKYQFYKFEESRIPETFVYERNKCFFPRPNQQEAINNFKKAVRNGRTNLLMYAVMRFGKSFTSMCCATEISAKLVVVVSAKKDVKEEWKKTVESIKRFYEYEFVDSDKLLETENYISSKIVENQKIVLFLTLQDLQGDSIKNKHKELFSTAIDLLIIDETHFGARAEEYGKVLSLSKAELKKELKNSDETYDQLDDILKVLDANIRLHLSGTPYRILMGSEFEKEDIIAFYQFSDIADDQQDWDNDNLNRDEVKEWDNPYYGFPQMVRFAFNPSKSARRRLEALRNNSMSYSFSALFKPKSILKDPVSNNHKAFEFENEILELFEIIDGSKSEENILSFLDYDKIKEGNMCRHIVIVLPYRASCDALENLILSNKSKFKNLNSYEIINVSGVENETLYRTVEDVKRKIKTCEVNNIKTITLTVNRLLTGTTVEEWDTMLYLKDTSSPQEYDQAIFRLQNQYIKELVDESGDVIKFNMKPQTLLVDFSPNRVFIMQEQKAQIYNVNTDANGNNKLEERLRRELEISPIITINKNKIIQIEATDVLDVVRKYSSERSVLDEALDIPVDFKLLDIALIKDVIQKQGEIGSKQALKIENTDIENGDDLDIPSDEIESSNESSSNINKNKDQLNEDTLRKKFATYYSKILFFSFLTDSKIKTLSDIIDLSAKVENTRILNNLGLNIKILSLLNDNINPFILTELDYKIQNINSLANDDRLSEFERATIALNKFSRLSDSEVVTPRKVARSLIELIPVENVDSNFKVLDIASKQGEFVYATFQKFGKDVANNFYSIPTSKIAYEFTRKVYTLLGLDINKIENSYSSYDLLHRDDIVINNEIKINNTAMKFDAIVGNPPYHEKDGGAGASALPIYNLFVDIAKSLKPRYISMIIPTRWFSGGKNLSGFRNEMLNDIHISELHDFLDPKVLFKETNNRGGICYFLWDKNYNNKNDLTKISTYKSNEPKINYRLLKNEDNEIYIRHQEALEIISKIKTDPNFESFEKIVSARKPFNIESNIIKKENIFVSKQINESYIKCYGKGQKTGFIEKKIITKNIEWIDKYKVFTPRANNIGTELQDDNLNTFIGEPGSVCTEAYMFFGLNLNLNLKSSENLRKYMSTKFARFLHSLSKASHDATSKTYKFVPIQDFSENSDINWSIDISKIDAQLYSKYNLSTEEIIFIEESIKPM